MPPEAALTAARGSATFTFGRAIIYEIMNIYAIKMAGVFMIATSTQLFPAARGPGYTLALSAGEPVGGHAAARHAYQKERGGRWLGMLPVPRCPGSGPLRRGYGGKVVVSPRFLAGRGEVALLQDREGAPFGVIRSVAGDPDCLVSRIRKRPPACSGQNRFW